VQPEDPVGDIDDFDFGNRADCADDFLRMVLAARADRDAARHGLAVGGDNVDTAKVTAVAANPLGDAGEHADAVRVIEPHGKRMAHRRCCR
jgi:hypothetical protein